MAGDTGELAFVATMRDEASQVAKSARASLDAVGGPTTPIVTQVKVDAAQAEKLLDTLPKNAKGTVSETSAEFHKLSPEMKTAVLDAKAAALSAMAGLPAGVKSETDKAGQEIPPPLKKGGEEGGKGLVDGILGGLSGMKGKLAGGLAALGIGSMVSEAMDQNQVQSKLAAALGAGPKLARKYGKMTSDIYAGAWGDSVDEVSAAIEATATSIKGLGSGDRLKGATEQALNYASTFDVDVTRAVQVAGNAISNGLAPNATAAFDLITRASQKVPMQLREDVLDAADEYGQFFHSLGFNGQQAFGALTANAQKGMYGIDKAGDAVKEFTIRSTDMSKASVGAYKRIGLNAHDMANDLLAGGDTAHGAFQKIVGGLLAIKDPAKRANTAIALFGTPLEDMNVKDIPAFLRSLTRMDGGLGKVKGASDKMGKTLNDNARTNLTSFYRTLKQGAVNVIGGQVVPKINDLAKKAGPLLGPAFRQAGDAIKATTGFLKDHATTAKILAGVLVALVAAEKAHAAVLAVQAAGGIVAYLKNLKLVAYATKVWAAVQWILNSALLANPITLIILAVIALIAIVVLLVKHWDTVKKALIAAWDAIKSAASKVWDAIKGAISRAWEGIKNLIGRGIAFVKYLFFHWSLLGIIISHWDKIKAAIAKAWDGIKSWVAKGIAFVKNLFLKWSLLGIVISHWDKIKTAISNAWGKIKSAVSTGIAKVVDLVRGLGGKILNGVGNLGRLLWDTGKSIIRGLLDGIEAMIGALRDKLHSVTKLIPDWKGPMRVDRKLLDPTGRAIMGGLIGGIAGQEGALRSQLSGITGLIESSVSPDLSTLSSMANAAAFRPLSTVRTSSVVTIRHEVVSPDGSVSDMTAEQIADLIARDPKSATRIEGALRGPRSRRAGSTITASR